MNMRIICLTEETVETLYLLGCEDFIQGVSQYVERPPEAKNKHPIVSQFIRSDVEKIAHLKPDLVIGFSDLQKNIASELIGLGLNVLVTNQRSLEEILDTMLLVGRLVDRADRARELVDQFKFKRDEIQKISRKFSFRPKVYFEEWDHPRFSCIQWVSEIIHIAGGENIFSDKVGAMACDREVFDEQVIERNPDIIFGCWCGKPVKTESFLRRYPTTSAVVNHCVWELDPAIFLQPGPALFLDGLDLMFKKIQESINLTKKKSSP